MTSGRIMVWRPFWRVGPSAVCWFCHADIGGKIPTVIGTSRRATGLMERNEFTCRPCGMGYLRALRAAGVEVETP